MPYYKLTDQNMTTHVWCQWVLGEQKRTSGEGELCSRGWLHCYDSPLLAVLLNPIHAKIDNPRLFRVKVAGKRKTDHGLKFGFTRMTLVEEIPVPVITVEQRIAFGILCAKQIYGNIAWNRWADRWLSGEDRTTESAWAAADDAARSAAYAAKTKPINLKKLAREAMKCK